MSKQSYTQGLVNIMTNLAQLSSTATSTSGAYFARGYDSNGADPIVDGDVAGLGITAADVGSLINIVNDFNTFLDTGGRRTIINKVRGDV